MLPPHNLDAEEAVLGALMLVEKPMYTLVIEVGLKPEHFYRARHRLVFEAMLDLYAEADAIDVVTVSERLKQTGKLDEVGGQEAIDALVGPVPEVSNLKDYAEIVKDNWKLRRLLQTTFDIQADVHGHAATPDDLVERAERRILEVAHDDRQQDFRAIDEILLTESRKWEQLSQSGADLTGTPTGYGDLDRITGGLQPGNLVILAARPSMGKSTLAMNFAENAAVDHGRPVAVFSLEMSEAELAQRFMASRARVPGNKIREGKITAGDWSKISETTNQLAAAKLYLDDSSDLSVLDVRAKSRRLHQQLGGLGMIVIDYLQLLRADSSVESRVLQIGEMSRGLKMLARELEVPVVALSQLSRAVEQRPDKKPMLSDLRESGCLSGETRIHLASTCERVPIVDLVGRSGFEVLALDPDRWTLVPRRVKRAFSTGVKPVLRLTTVTGRTLRLTANHPLRTLEGWSRVDELSVGDLVATRNVALANRSEASGSFLGPTPSNDAVVAAGPATATLLVPTARESLLDLAVSDLLWDAVASIEPDGEEEVFDLEVEGLHSFVAEDVVVHNSIEQDADVVLFIYRPDYYRRDDDDEPVDEDDDGASFLTVAKHRNGGLGEVKLAFIPEYPKFMSIARDRYAGGGGP